MPALLDTLDRFNYTSTSIRSLASSQLHDADPGPFTAAILQLTPQDLLRDADEAEYGLFTFVRDASDTPAESLVTQGKVGRREFRGATPLRVKRVGPGNKDEEPEVYVEAALKYLDRFHAIKPMSHARSHLENLVDKLNDIRDNMERIQSSMNEIAQNGRASPKSQATEEERRISELKSRIIQLRKRKEALASKLPADTSKTQLRSDKGVRALQKVPKHMLPRRSLDSPSSGISTPPSQPKPKPKAQLRPPIGRSRVAGPSTSKSKPQSYEDPDEQERLFWSGKKPPRLGLDDPSQSSSLLDEKLDMSGFDLLMSPTPPTPSSRISKSPDVPVLGDPIHDENSADDRSEGDEDEDSDSGEPTVVLSKPAPPRVTSSPDPSATAPPSPPPSRPPSQVERPELHTPVQNDKTATAPPSTKTKVKKVRVTAEVDRICTKIWSTIPDLLVPGNNFSSPGKKPPNSRDTLSVLQTISAQSIPGPTSDSVSSPSTRSTLSSLLGIETLGPAGGSPHQIMTAHVLLALLTAPNHAMPLTALKALLASKTGVPSPGPDAGREAKQNAAAMGASAAQASTRALYGCVAKKLVKIDRGGGEQVVKFD